MSSNSIQADVLIIGAGAAGLMCAAQAGQRSLSVVLIDHAERIAEKIRISGGGRCNFTNLHISAEQYLSENPDFCRSALAAYGPQDFLKLLSLHGVSWHEKHKGQLFCDGRSTAIIDLLLAQCRSAQVQHLQPCALEQLEAKLGGFVARTSLGVIHARQVVVATGGLSVPKIGASDLGYRLAKQWGHTIVPTRPGLVPLTFDASDWAPWADLSGVSLPCAVQCKRAPGRIARRRSPSQIEFFEDLLFTHQGLSGPGILQISNYWQPGTPLRLNLLAGLNLSDYLVQAKQGSRQVAQVLAEFMPARLAHTWLAQDPWSQLLRGPLSECTDTALRALATGLQSWQLTPSGTQGWAKAEVTLGGVSTHELNSKTMQSSRVAGLHFIGEVVDVTGWLGGYNFQWAWSSAVACARSLLSKTDS